MLELLVFAALSITSVATSTDNGEDVTQTLTLPATIAADDLILCSMGTDGVATHSWPGLWAEIQDTQNSQVSASTAWLKAVGTEDGTTINVTTSVAETAIAKCWAIDGWDQAAPEIAVATGQSASADPPNIAPAGGTDDYLYLALGVQDGTRTVTGFPAGYSNTGSVVGGGSVATMGFGDLLIASSAAEDPSTFTFNVTDFWIATTIAVSPAAAGGGGGPGGADCVATAPTVTAGETLDTRVFPPCRQRAWPNQTDDINDPVTLHSTYFVAGCSSGAVSPSWSATDLPAGLSINANTGIITGTITASGTHSSEVTCTNSEGFASSAFMWTVGGESCTTVSGYFVGTGGNNSNTGQTHAQRWATFFKANDAPAGATVNYLADSTFNEKGTLNDNNQTLQTYYRSGTSNCEWTEGNGAKANLHYSTGLTNAPDNLLLSITADGVTLKNLKVSGENHNQFGTDQLSIIDIRGTDGVTLDEVDVQAWPSETELITAQTADQAFCTKVLDSSNITVLGGQYNACFLGLLFSNTTTVDVDGTSFESSYRDHLRFGSSSPPTDFNGLVKNITCGTSLTSDCVQFESSGCGQNPPCHGGVRFQNVRATATGLSAENFFDLKGAQDVLIENSVITRSQMWNDGETEEPAGNRTAGLAITRGGSATDTETARILIRNNILYDAGGGFSGMEGFNIINNTALAANRDFTGPNSAFVPNNGQTNRFQGVYTTFLMNNGVAMNNILCHSNLVDLYFYDFLPSSVTVDGNFYCTGASKWIIGNGEAGPPNATQYTNFSTYQTAAAAATGSSVGDNGGNPEANSTEGDPMFVTLPTVDPVGDYVALGYDWNLQASSDAIDAAVPWTRVNDSGGGSGTILVVDKSSVFWDGRGPSDYIKIGSEAVVEVLSIDHSTNTLTLASSRTWSDNDAVWLADSGGQIYNDAGGCQRGLANVCD